MAKENSARSAPKRGAFPTPIKVLLDAIPCEPVKSGQSDLVAHERRSESSSTEESGRPGNRTGGIAMIDQSGAASNVGTAGTPPPSKGATAAASQVGASNVGTAGTPPPPKAATAVGSQIGAGYVGTAGTPPRPSGATAVGSQAGAGYVGTAGTPPPK